MTNLGDKIKRLRLDLGIRQDDLAAMAGITNSSISNYERNTRSPQYDVLCKIAKALGVPVAELLKDTAMETKDTDDAQDSSRTQTDSKRPRRIKKLMAAFDKLSNEAQLIAIERVEELALIPKYKMTLPEALQRYINNKFLLVYELSEDTNVLQPFERGLPFGDRYCRINTREIIFKKKEETETTFWYFNYYQIKIDDIKDHDIIDDDLVEDIIFQNLRFEDCQEKHSLVFDDEKVYDKFCDCYESIMDYSDVDDFSPGNDNGPELSLFLIDRETSEIRDMYEYS